MNLSIGSALLVRNPQTQFQDGEEAVLPKSDLFVDLIFIS
jgi:hypothetical protein